MYDSSAKSLPVVEWLYCAPQYENEVVHRHHRNASIGEDRESAKHGTIRESTFDPRIITYYTIYYAGFFVNRADALTEPVRCCQ